jgi:hypothetical protein
MQISKSEIHANSNIVNNCIHMYTLIDITWIIVTMSLVLEIFVFVWIYVCVMYIMNLYTYN